MTKQFGNYFLTKEQTHHIIRQHVVINGKKSSLRLPKSNYTHLTSTEALQKYVNRLNGREHQATLKEIELKLSFLPVSLLEEFRELLQSEIPTKKDADNHYRNLHRYFFKYFVDHLKLKDPTDWKMNESKWGRALLNEDSKLNLYEDNKPRAVKTIKGIIQTANRFMSFLNKKYPKEYSLVVLEPISKAKFKDYHAKLNLDSEPIGKYIQDAHWSIIEKDLPLDIKPYVCLAYYYGLRRSETLGFVLSDLANGYLNVKRQLLSLNNIVPLKNRTNRKTPHWFVNPKVTYALIQSTLNKKIHPDTLSIRFTEYMKDLGFSYQMHDLRRTFITRALELNNGNATPVMIAVGHSDTSITMKYLRDNRIMDDAVYNPNST